MIEEMIHAQSLGFQYPGTEQPALQEITLRIPEGQLVCLCGINGSGKSTLFSLLAGLATPTSGTLTIAGHTAGKTTQDTGSTNAAEAYFRKQSALVLQDADLQIIGSTVEEDMLLSFPQEDHTAAELAATFAKQFGLEAHWDAPVHTLSYGQKRKLCLAVALLSTPSLLLLDEPFSGLDYPSIQEMRSILMQNQAQGLTQIISVHDLEPVVDLAEQIVVLHHGKQVLTGPPHTVLESISEYGVRTPCSWQQGQGIAPWK